MNEEFQKQVNPKEINQNKIYVQKAIAFFAQTNSVWVERMNGSSLISVENEPEIDYCEKKKQLNVMADVCVNDRNDVDQRSIH